MVGDFGLNAIAILTAISISLATKMAITMEYGNVGMARFL